MKLVCCVDDKFGKPVEVHRGEDAVKKLLDRVLELEKEAELIRTKHFNKPLVMSEEDKHKYHTSIECHICGRECVEGDLGTIVM